MKDYDYRIVYYGINGDDIGQHESVGILSADEQVSLLGHDFSDPTKFHGDDANVANPLYTEFNRRLREALTFNVADEDIVALPFGVGHAAAVQDVRGSVVETGIGYPDTFARFRIFESNAWMHLHQGKYGRQGSAYEWVIPNYFVSEDWTYQPKPEGYIAFLGRITELKGLSTIVEVAKARPDLHFLICGQGDPKPYLVAKNIHYVPPMTGRERNEYLCRARAVIMPSQFTEPFGGVAVEAMMTGTPVLSTSFGAFTETIEHGRTGFHCRTLGDYLKALDLVDGLDRQYISERAHSLYSLEAVAPQYDRVFHQIQDLHGDGWYSRNSYWV